MAARRRVTVERIVDTAAELLDRDGPDALTMGRIAAALGVRPPSLYNHVDGLGEVRRLVTIRSIEELGEALQRGAVGHSGAGAVRAMARASRDFARAHPGRYATTVPTTEVDDDEVRRAGSHVVDTVVDALAGYGFDRDDAIHATRSLRAAVHGFVALELAGGFGLEQSPDDTFEWMVDLLTDGFAARRATSQLPAPR
jgi:AcrR family transcriptional regulator